MLQPLNPAALAADKDQEIFNQLYREIIGSSPAGKTAKMDSMRSPAGTFPHDPETASPPGGTADIVSERLKKEIDKIVQDAQIRHSDAVKFIQDTK
jgi:hypothetical protein